MSISQDSECHGQVKPKDDSYVLRTSSNAYILLSQSFDFHFGFSLNTLSRDDSTSTLGFSCILFSRHPFDFHLGFDHTLYKISMTTICYMMLLSSNHSTSMYLFPTSNMLCSQCAYAILNHKVIPPVLQMRSPQCD